MCVFAVTWPFLSICCAAPTRLAADGSPPGLRMVQMPLEETSAALEEVDAVMRRRSARRQLTLEMQYKYTSLKSGVLNRCPGEERYPMSYALMRKVEQAFGLAGRVVDRVQVMARSYQPGMKLAGHIDSEVMFQEPVLSVVLRKGGPDDGLVLRRRCWHDGRGARAPGLAADEGETYWVPERPGLAVCLEGDARYEFDHAVPPVAQHRISLTWRWFHPEYLAGLLGAAQRGPEAEGRSSAASM